MRPALRPPLGARVPLPRPLVPLFLAATLAFAANAGAAAPPPATALAADALVGTRGPDRDARLDAWMRTASFDDLLWLLRRDPAELGPLEARLADAALRKAPAARMDLRRRLEARRLLADPAALRKAGRDAAELEAMRPRASAWRVAALLPDQGDYASYGAEVRAGLAVGLSSGRPAGARPIALDVHATGEGDPARGAAALDTASRACAVVVGELLSVPTLPLAAATRVLGMPLVSPTATDESIGRMGPLVFQCGPSGERRAARLAAAVLAARGKRVGIVVSGAADESPFAHAFPAAAESLGATIVRRERYAPGTIDFRPIVKSLSAAGAEVVFWDGESREADALVRELAAEGVKARLCGGTALSPERFHAPARTLLEGVAFVADEWRLPASVRADSASAHGGDPGPLWTRGWLAGRRIAAAVDAGARTPAELGARLRGRDPVDRDLGFLDAAAEGADLPVFTIVRGRAVEPPAAGSAQ